jgi:hypothetical protein
MFLPGLASRLRQLRRHLLRRGNILATLFQLIFIGVAVFIGIGVVSILLTALLAGLLQLAWPERAFAAFASALAAWLAFPAAPYLDFPLGAAATAMMLALVRRRVIRRRERYFERIDADIELMLEDARARRDPSGPRVSARRRAARPPAGPATPAPSRLPHQP